MPFMLLATQWVWAKALRPKAVKIVPMFFLGRINRWYP
uniref:Uncharacterized protein n=1 Tax=Arundo donax TaxID=35708 RepID=A0A0A8YD58_ARUDO